jgi:hypothetical protein
MSLLRAKGTQSSGALDQRLPGSGGWRFGLPLLGDALTFGRDPAAFVKARSATHGPIFHARLLSHQAVVVTGMPELRGALNDLADHSEPAHCCFAPQRAAAPDPEREAPPEEGESACAAPLAWEENPTAAAAELHSHQRAHTHTRAPKGNSAKRKGKHKGKRRQPASTTRTPPAAVLPTSSHPPACPLHLGHAGSMTERLADLYGHGVGLLDVENARPLRELLCGVLDGRWIAGRWSDRLERALHTDARRARLRSGEPLEVYAHARDFVADTLLWVLFDMAPGSARSERFQALSAEHFRGVLSMPMVFPGGGYKRALSARDQLRTLIRDEVRRYVAAERERGHASVAGTVTAAASSCVCEELVWRWLRSQALCGAIDEQSLVTQLLWISSRFIPKTVASAIASLTLQLGQDDEHGATLQAQLHAVSPLSGVCTDLLDAVS